MKGLLVGAAVAAVLVVPSAAVRAQDWSIPVQHTRYTGAFDFTGTSYEGLAVACGGDALWQVRFWEHGNAGNTNSFTADPTPRCYEWLQNAALDLGLPWAHPGQFHSVHANWANPGVQGEMSIEPPEVTHTVMELSFADPEREGGSFHRGLYAVATVANTCQAFDLDNISDGTGPSGNIVQVQAIPPPIYRDWWFEPNGVDPSYVDLYIHTERALEYGSTGHPEAIAGFLILYKHSPTPPDTSSPAFYDGEVSDPGLPSRPLGMVRNRNEMLEVSAPYPPPGEKLYLVTQLVYEGEQVRSRATSASTYVDLLTGHPFHANVVVWKDCQPDEVEQGDTVSCNVLVVNWGAVDAVNVEIWDILSQELASGCVDLASVRNLSCPGCTSFDHDPVYGRLTATVDVLAPNDWVAPSFEVDAGPGFVEACRNTAWVSAEGHAHEWASTSFHNWGDLDALLRDDSITSLSPRPDLEAIFPLELYRRPTPPLPFVDDPGLLGDPDHPLVFYQVTNQSRIRLTKDLVGDSVVVDR